MRPPRTVVLHLLAHAESAKGTTPRRRDAGGEERDAVGAHRESPHGRHVLGDSLKHQRRHVNHHFGSADGLLGVDEPARTTTGLQGEVAPAHRIREQVFKNAFSSVAHVNTT